MTRRDWLRRTAVVAGIVALGETFRRIAAHRGPWPRFWTTPAVDKDISALRGQSLRDIILDNPLKEMDPPADLVKT